MSTNLLIEEEEEEARDQWVLVFVSSKRLCVQKYGENAIKNEKCMRAKYVLHHPQPHSTTVHHLVI